MSISTSLQPDHPVTLFLALLFTTLVVWLAIELRTLIKLVAQLPRKSAFRAKSLLTANEAEFFGRLKRALPDFDILPQVAMGALIAPTAAEGSQGHWQTRRQFQSKICDYVICRKNSGQKRQVIAVVELDDRTHDRKKDARRDAMLAAAGIPTIRFESRAKPTPARIRETILALA